MRAIIELKKVEQYDLQLFLRALKSYISVLQILQETTTENRKYAIEMSIAAELWYELQKRTIGQFPAEHSLLKLSLHKAYILCQGLQDYSDSLDVEAALEKSRCNRYSTAIDQQIPTSTQLALNK